jgi:hypothetical protein
MMHGTINIKLPKKTKITLNSRVKQNKDAKSQHQYRNAAPFVTNVIVHIILHIYCLTSWFYIVSG